MINNVMPATPAWQPERERAHQLIISLQNATGSIQTHQAERDAIAQQLSTYRTTLERATLRVVWERLAEATVRIPVCERELASADRRLAQLRREAAERYREAAGVLAELALARAAIESVIELNAFDSVADRLRRMFDALPAMLRHAGVELPPAGTGAPAAAD